jgi:hypothetical protein
MDEVALAPGNASPIVVLAVSNERIEPFPVKKLDLLRKFNIAVSQCHQQRYSLNCSMQDNP